jgi:hypothetical protein
LPERAAVAFDFRVRRRRTPDREHEQQPVNQPMSHDPHGTRLLLSSVRRFRTRRHRNKEGRPERDLVRNCSKPDGFQCWVRIAVRADASNASTVELSLQPITWRAGGAPAHAARRPHASGSGRAASFTETRVLARRLSNKC